MAQKAKKKSKLRHAEYYDMQKTFDSLYADSKSGEVFGHLMDIISAPSNIKLAFRNVKGNDSHMKEYSSMNYGWATVFTLAAWFAGLVIDVNVRVGDLGLRTVLPVIVMGCCIMKFIKDNNIQ